MTYHQELQHRLFQQQEEQVHHMEYQQEFQYYEDVANGRPHPPAIAPAKRYYRIQCWRIWYALQKPASQSAVSFCRICCNDYPPLRGTRTGTGTCLYHERPLHQ